MRLNEAVPGDEFPLFHSFDMEKAGTFELRVVFDSGNYFAYQNPSDTICYQLAGCPDWEPAMTVVWRNLPAHWHANFFQENDCTNRAGDVHVVANSTSVIVGANGFKPTRAIRSIHARRALGTVRGKVTQKCVQLRHPMKEALESNTTEYNSGAGVSSNWFEPIEGED